MRSSPLFATALSVLVVASLASCSSESKKSERTSPNIDVALDSKLLTLEEKIDAVAATQARSEGADPEKVAKLEKEVRELTEFLLRESTEPTEKSARLEPTSKGSTSDHQIAALEKQVVELQQRMARLESDRSNESPSGSDAAKPIARQSAPPKGQLDWRVAANWRGLKRGMAKDQVSTLFGEPTKIRTSQSLTMWYYGYPSGGQITFNGDSVSGWDEP